MLKKWFQTTSKVLKASESPEKSLQIEKTENDLLTITVLEICRQVYVTCAEQGEVLLECLTRFVKSMLDHKGKYQSLEGKNDEKLAQEKQDLKLKFIKEMMVLEAKIVGLERDQAAKDQRLEILEKEITTFNGIKKR